MCFVNIYLKTTHKESQKMDFFLSFFHFIPTHTFLAAAAAANMVGSYDWFCNDGDKVK